MSRFIISDDPLDLPPTDPAAGFDWQIPPEVQAKRDEARMQLLQDELKAAPDDPNLKREIELERQKQEKGAHLRPIGFTPTEPTPSQKKAGRFVVSDTPLEFPAARSTFVTPQAKPAEEEKPGVVSSIGRGLAHGMLGLAEAVNLGGQFLSARFGAKDAEAFFKSGAEFWERLGKDYETPEALQGNILDKPELLGSGAWWAYHVADMAPSLAASIIPAAGAHKAITIGGKALELTPQVIARLARIGAAVTGGAAGGSLEGVQTYKEVLDRGASEAEAATAGTLMTLASAGLNALSLGTIFGPAKNKVMAFLTSGATEGLTEWLEEPAEGAILSSTSVAKPEDAPLTRMREGINVLPIAAVMGGGAGAVAHRKPEAGPAPDAGAPVDLADVPPAAPAAPAADDDGFVRRGVVSTDDTGDEALRAQPTDETGAKPVPAFMGAPTTFATERGSELEGQWALVDADDLIASHTVDLRENPAYPAELQPRDRSRAASEIQVARIANKINPNLLNESPLASQGAPIIGADGVVESGNARTIALKRAYASGNAEAYRQFIYANAHRFGVEAGADSLRNPVLVRVRKTPVNRAEFARQANEATVAQMSPVEQAHADAQRIGNLDDLVIDENGEIDSPSNRGFIRRFVASLPVTEQGAMADAEGRLSQSGMARVRNAILSKAYGDSGTLMRLVESLDDNTRNISRALTRVAPMVAKVRESIAQGALHDRDITQDVIRAVEEFSKLRARKMTVGAMLAQSSFFGHGLTPETISLLTFLEENSRSPNRIAAFIEAYLSALEGVGNPAQAGLFGESVAPSKEELLETARQRTAAADEAGSGLPARTEPAAKPAAERAGATEEPGAERVPEPAEAGAARGDGPDGAGRAEAQPTERKEPDAPKPVEAKESIKAELRKAKEKAKTEKPAPKPAAAPEPKKAKADGFGAKNKVFTQDAAEKAREVLRKKLGQLNAGLDPEMMQAGIQLAGFYIEGGARKFTDYAAKMVEDLGEGIRPFLKSFYAAVRAWPGMDAAGMDDDAAIDAALAQPKAEEKPEAKPEPKPAPEPDKAAKVESLLAKAKEEQERATAWMTQTRKASDQDNWPKLREAFDRYDDTGDITIGELVDEVEALVAEGDAPESLQEAVDSYRGEEEDDRAFAGRNDMDAAEEAFVEAVTAAMQMRGTVEEEELVFPTEEELEQRRKADEENNARIEREQAQRDREQQAQLDRGEPIEDIDGWVTWSDSKAPVSPWRVPEEDWPHLILWDWMHRDLDRMREHVAELTSLKLEPTTGKKKKAGLADFQHDRDDPKKMAAALAWAEAGGAKKYPLPKHLRDLDRTAPAYIWEYEAGKRGLMRRYVIPTEKGNVQVNLDFHSFLYDQNESDNFWGVKAEAYGQSISETGFRSLLGTNAFDPIATMADPYKAAVEAVEALQKEHGAKQVKLELQRQKERAKADKTKAKKAQGDLLAAQEEKPAKKPEAPAAADYLVDAAGEPITFYRGLAEGAHLPVKGPVFLALDAEGAKQYADFQSDWHGKTGERSMVTARVKAIRMASVEDVDALGKLLSDTEYQDELIKTLRDRGFDGAYYREEAPYSGPGSSGPAEFDAAVVFDPRNVEVLATESLEGPTVDAAAHDAATSPNNDLPEPTRPQIEAGNYQKGHIKVGGLDISIENPAGSTRSGVDANGKPWSVTMQDHYGYIRGTVGRDKDHIDVFVKVGTPEDYDGEVYVIDQRKPGNGHFDEHKVMIGWGSFKEAEDAYYANYSKGWKGLEGISLTTMDGLKLWFEEGDTKDRFSNWRIARRAAAAHRLYDFVNAFPWPVNDIYMHEALEETPFGEEEESLKIIHQEQAAEMLGYLNDEHAIREALREGVDPKTGKAPRTPAARKALDKRLREELDTVTQNFEDAESAYIDAFGEKAGIDFHAFLVDKARKLRNPPDETGSIIPGKGATHEPDASAARPQARDGQADLFAEPGGAADRGSVGGGLAEGDAGAGSAGTADRGDQGAGEPGGDGAGGRPGERQQQPSGGPRADGSLWDRAEPARVDPANYTLTDADKIGEGGAKAKFRDNIAAIQLAKQLTESNTNAIPEEQAILARYVGWGGLKQAFDPENKDWAKEYAELKAALTEEEYERARRSILDAHYTSVPVIRAMHAALARLGFKGGRVLEPSMGVGHFFGLMPTTARGNSSLVGVELDPITGAIAKLLYPKARIVAPKGFQEVSIPKDYFDVAIGNPPFGSQSLYDSEYPEISKFSIHNFFFAKSLESIRPGGLMQMVVSRYFLDQQDSTARAWIARRAELIGAVRLPNTAFKGNAGTEVVTDVLLFQKRETPLDAKAELPDWVRTVDVQVPTENGGVQTITRSRYYEGNEGNILGRESTSGSMYRSDEYTVEAEGDLARKLKEWVDSLPADLYKPPAKRVEELTDVDGLVPEDAKVGAFFITSDGGIARRLPDQLGQRRMAKIEIESEMGRARIKGMVKVRDALRRLMRAELSDASAAAIELRRQSLNEAYDAFVKKYGYINALGNRRAFQEDPDLPLLESLEPKYDPGVSKAVAKKHGIPEKAPSAEKAAIFTKRVLAPVKTITRVETPKEALVASLNEKGGVDLEYMAQIAGVDQDTITRELTGLIYDDPEMGWVTAEQYLSGNVKAKLAAAKEAAAKDSRYTANVDALERVQPPDIEALDIAVRLGSPWIPPEVIATFSNELIGGRATANYIPSVGRWSYEASGVTPTMNTQQWGTERAPAKLLIASLLNYKQIVVKDNIGTSEKPEYVVNEVETQAAQAKAEAIQQKFREWIWADAKRREDLAKLYNAKFNTDRRRTYDGSHLEFPGMSPEIKLRPHQKNAVWRWLQDRTILLDHVVGAGKTYTLVAGVMEMRRLGLARKPTLVVPNYLVRQWRDEFYKAYPNANILACTEADFSKQNRERLFSRIATGDWDAVIVPHSSFKKVGMPPDTEAAILGEMVNDLTVAIQETKTARGDRHVIKDMERIKERLESRAKRLSESGGQKDKAVHFGELGIDALAVDEAHLFKNLFYFSQMQGVAGLGNPSGSGRAFDMFVKVRYLQQMAGERGIVAFATGTPVSNSLVEMFTMQRYLQYKQLRDRGIHLLDPWAGVFGDVQQVYEVHPSGNGYRLATRFAKFVNLPELMTMYRSFADVITMKDLKAQAAARGQVWPIPKRATGKPILNAAERSPEQVKFFGVPEFERDAEGNIVFESNPAQSEVMDRVEWLARNNLGGEALSKAWTPDKPKFAVVSIDGDRVLYPTKFFDTREEAVADRDVSLRTPRTRYNEGSILWKFDNLKALMKDSNGRVNALSITNEARKAGLDYRLIDPNAPDFEGSKINRAVDNIFRIYQKWAEDKGAQLVFCDLSIPNSARSKIAKQAQEQQAKEAGDAIGDQGAEVAEEEAAPQGEEEAAVSIDQLLALGSKHSVYDDVKAKLIKRGIPEAEIAFIHDYDTADKKAKLFAKVRSGEVRVLIGSTEKMGAGMNVQERLVGMHHLDAPWRPSDLEQRNGRWERQGNALYARDPDGFEVEEHRYATKQTYDTRMWQIIEHKANGVEQLRNADATTARSIEDISGEAATAADMKAAASGNPLILEEIKLRNHVQKLEAEEDVYLRGRHRMEATLPYLRQAPERAAAERQKMQPWVDRAAKNPPFEKDAFEIEIAGNKITDKAAVGGPLIGEAGAALKRPSDQVVAAGKYRGFHFGFERFGTDTLLGLWSLDGQTWERFTQYGKGDEFKPAGFLQRLDNAIEGLAVDLKAIAIDEANDLKRAQEVEQELTRPFEKKAELEAARKAHRAIVQRLQAQGGAIEMTPDMRAELEEALAKRGLGKLSRNEYLLHGMAAADVKEIVRRMTVNLRNAPPIHVWQNWKEAPRHVREFIRERKAEYNGAGAFIEDEIHLFADNIADEGHAVFTLVHELEHFGLLGMLGDELAPVLGEIFEDSIKVQMRVAKLRARDSALSKLDAIEEALADMGGEMVRDGKRPGWWKQLVAAFRDWLRRRGVRIALSDNDIDFILERALEYSKRPPRKGYAHVYRRGSLSQRAMKLADLDRRVQALEARVDAAYEAGSPEAEDLDAELAVMRERLFSAYEEFGEDEPSADNEPAGLEENLVSAYLHYMRGGGPFASRADALLNMRGAIEEAGGKPGSDEQVLAAAKDAYEARVARRTRQWGALSRQADNIGAMAFKRATDPAGNPIYYNDELGLTAGRVQHGYPGLDGARDGRHYMIFDIVDRTKRNAKGRARMVGTFHGDVDLDGNILNVRVIEILEEFRQGGAGYGESVVAGILAGNPPGQLLEIINIVVDKEETWEPGKPLRDARGFWKKMGTVFQPVGDDEYLNGILTLGTYLRARRSGGKLSRNADPLHQAGNALRSGPGQQAAGRGQPSAQQPDARGTGAGGPGGGRDGGGNRLSGTERRVEEILSRQRAGFAPLETLTRVPVQALRLDRVTSGVYDRLLELIGGFIPAKVKAGVVSDYGLPEAVTDRRDLMFAHMRTQLRGVENTLMRLSNLTRAESRVVYDWLNQRNADHLIEALPEESRTLLHQVREQIDQMGKEAVRLGQLSEASYEANKLAYVHRSYRKYDLAEGEQARTARARAIRILGDQYKGRGISDAVAMDKVGTHDFWEKQRRAGKADRAQVGREFYRLERRENRGEGVMVLPGMEGSSQAGRVLEVLYWPVDTALPARYQAWHNAGTWKARDIKGPRVIMWRDFTKEERERMGEIDEARYAIAKTFHQMIHDIEAGRYLEWLANTQSRPEPEGPVVEASESMATTFAPGTWVKVPTTEIPGTSTKKFGKLAGLWIPGPIWNDVRQVVNWKYQPLGEFYSKILRAWKISKTALSPAVHANNVMANVMMADWHDVRARHLVAALDIMLRPEDPAHKAIVARFEDAGGTQGMYVLNELQREQLRPIMDQLRREVAEADDVGIVKASAVLQLMLSGKLREAMAAAGQTKAVGAASKGVNAMVDFYQTEDTVFRLAAFIKAKGEGRTDAEAGKFARRSFLDYQINAPWIQALRQTAFPFLAFTYRALPMIAETAARRPWKLLKLGLVLGAANALGYALSGGDEDDERKLLPEEKAGRVFGFLAPKLIRMPWNDKHGSPVFLDIRRWIPLGDIVDVGQTHAAVPILPMAVPGGPVAVLAELLFNKSQFTGKEIVKDTDTGLRDLAHGDFSLETYRKVVDHLYKAFTPNFPLLPGSYSATALLNAGGGKTDAFGREQSVIQAAASSVGVKLGSYPKDELRRNALLEYKALDAEIDRGMRSIAREFSRKGITKAEFERKMAAQVAKKRRLAEEFRDRLS